MSRRVVITGFGIVSCLGNNEQSIADSLWNSKSGIKYNPKYKERGLKSHVSARPIIDKHHHIDRKALRFMGDASVYAAIAMQKAIESAGIAPSVVSSRKTGLIVGSEGISAENLYGDLEAFRQKGVKGISPFLIFKTMPNTVAASLSSLFKIKGVSYSLNSACATGTHCIGNAADLIRAGTQNVVFAGGGDEESWMQSMLFDRIGALSTKYNHIPEKASRPYDKNRDGFVAAGGAGIVVLEDYEHAINRGAKIYAEIAGYSVNCDGAEMAIPTGEGIADCMIEALRGIDSPVDYINAHGSGTPVGDMIEIDAIRHVFSNRHEQEGRLPPVSSTKGMSGHSLCAAGVHEVIYMLIMMQEGFVAGSINIDDMDEKVNGYPILTKPNKLNIKCCISNSIGFGGVNASIALRSMNV